MNTNTLYSLIESSIETTSAQSSPAAIGLNAVVGVGGIGMRCIRVLKSLIPPGQRGLVQLLAIDTDESENGSKAGLPRLEGREVVILKAGPAMEALNKAEAAEPNYRHILEYLPEIAPDGTHLHPWVHDKIKDNKGAGQLPRAGQLYLDANIDDGACLRRVVRDLKGSLTGLASAIRANREGARQTPRIRIYIIGSLSGGTGSGILSGLCALLHEEIKSEHLHITTVNVLPGACLDSVITRDEENRTRANAIGRLIEIQAAVTTQMAEDQLALPVFGKLRLSGRHALINQAYIVDHHTRNGNRAENLDEIYRAVGMFVFTTIWSGVGKVQEAGRVNNNRPENWADQAAPLCFNTFGVASVEIPAAALEAYALGRELQETVQAWLAAAVDDGKVESEVSALLEVNNVRSAASVLAAVTPELADLDFCDSAESRSDLLKRDDADFLTECERAIDDASTTLEREKARFAARCQQLRQNLLAGIDHRILTWSSFGAGSGKAMVDRLSRWLLDLADDLEKVRRQRNSRMDDIKRQFPSLDGKINRWDFGLDRGQRQERLTLTREYIRLLRDQAADQQAIRLSEGLRQHFEGLRAQFDQFHGEITTLGTVLGAELADLSRTPEGSAFFRHAIRHQEFAGWFEENRMPDLSRRIDLSELSVESFQREALDLVRDYYHQKIAGLNIVDLIVADPRLAAEVPALDAASEVLMQFAPNKPADSELNPRKFVVGAFARPGHPLVDQFYRLGTQDNTPVQVPNPHVLAVLQTVERFGAAHWDGFPDALSHYKADSWSTHTVLRPEELPPLVKATPQSEHLLHLLGFGLMTGSIQKYQKGYFVNLAENRDGGTTPYQFLTFRKVDEGGHEPEYLLVRCGLASMPEPMKLRPDSKLLLGTSLAQVVEKLGRGAAVPVVSLLERAATDLERLVGKNELGQAMEPFLAKLLKGTNDSAAGRPERELLTSMAGRLRAVYAA